MEFNEIKNSLARYSSVNSITLEDAIGLLVDVVEGIRRETGQNLPEMFLGTDEKRINHTGSMLYDLTLTLVEIYEKKKPLLNKNIKFQEIIDDREEVFANANSIKEKIREKENEYNTLKENLSNYTEFSKKLECVREEYRMKKKEYETKQNDYNMLCIELTHIINQKSYYENKIVEEKQKINDASKISEEKRLEFEALVNQNEKELAQNQKRAELLSNQIENISAQVAVAQNENINADETIKSYNKKLVELKNNISSMKDKQKMLQSELKNEEQTKAELEEVIETLDEKRASLMSIESDLKSKRSILEEKETELGKYKGELVEIEKNINRINIETNETNNKIAKQENEKIRLQSLKEVKQKEFNDSFAKLTNLNLEILEYTEKKIPEVTSQLQLKNEDYQKKTERYSGIKSELLTIEKKNEKLQEDIDKANNRISEIKKNIETKTKEKNDLNDRIKEKGDDEKKISDEIESLKKQAETKDIGQLRNLFEEENSRYKDLCEEEKEWNEKISNKKKEAEKIQNQIKECEQKLKEQEVSIIDLNDKLYKKQGELDKKTKEKNALVGKHNTIQQDYDMIMQKLSSLNNPEYAKKINIAKNKIQKINNVLGKMFDKKVSAYPIISRISEEEISGKIRDLQNDVEDLMKRIDAKQKDVNTIITLLEKRDSL